MQVCLAPSACPVLPLKRDDPDFPQAKSNSQLISLVRVIFLVGMVVWLQFGGPMGMIVRLQHVIGVIVLVTLFACRMIVAMAVLMRVRMDVRMRMLMAVNLRAMTMLMPVGVGVPMLMLMPVLVISSHGSVSFACVRSVARRSHSQAPLSSGYAGGGRAATTAARRGLPRPPTSAKPAAALRYFPLLSR